ncbi:hypothetical protein JZ751_018646, partial [Albula glossodonta]
SQSSATGSTFTGDHCHRPHPSLCQLGDGCFHMLRSTMFLPHQLQTANVRTSEVRYLKTRRGETALQVEGGRA